MTSKQRIYRMVMSKLSEMLDDGTLETKKFVDDMMNEAFKNNESTLSDNKPYSDKDAICLDDEYTEDIEDGTIVDYRSHNLHLYKLSNGKLAFFTENGAQFTMQFDSIEENPDDMPWDESEFAVVIADGEYHFIWLKSGAKMFKYGFDDVYDEVIYGGASAAIYRKHIEYEVDYSTEWKVEEINFTDNPHAECIKDDELANNPKKNIHGEFIFTPLPDEIQEQADESYLITNGYALVLGKNKEGRLQFVRSIDMNIPFTEDFDEIVSDEIGDSVIDGSSEEEDCILVKKDGFYNYINLKTGATVISGWLQEGIYSGGGIKKYCVYNYQDCVVEDGYITYEGDDGKKDYLKVDYSTNVFKANENKPYMTKKSSRQNDYQDYLKSEQERQDNAMKERGYEKIEQGVYRKDSDSSYQENKPGTYELVYTNNHGDRQVYHNIELSSIENHRQRMAVRGYRMIELIPMDKIG